MARSSSVMHSAFVNSLDGSTFGLSCWIDSTVTGDHLSGSGAVEYQNPPPHMSMMSFAVYDSFPPIEMSVLFIFLVFAMVCDVGKKATARVGRDGREREITIKSLLVWREKTWKMHRNSHCNRDLWNRKNIFQINGRREKNWAEQAFVTSEST